MKTDMERCRAYMAKIPPAISGAGGHGATFRAACECIRFGLSDGEAMALLREWNTTHCHPPWTEKELAHKLSDARTKAVTRPTRLGSAPRRPRMAAPPPVRVVWRLTPHDNTPQKPPNRMKP